MSQDLVYALTVGMVAAVNPCGFAMLPGYLALVVAGEDTSRAGRLGRALAAGALMSAGFVVVFGAFGLLGTPVIGSVQRYLPVVTLVIGLALVVLGVVLLAGREVTVLLPKLRGGAPTTRVTSMFGYGVAFAVASLSCTIGPFLAATGIAVASGEFTSVLFTFVAYALGMGLVVTVLAVAAALARTAVTGGMRRILPHVGRIGGGLLVLTGGYVGYYGYHELRLYHADGDADDPVIGAAADLQNTLEGWVDTIGPAWLLAALAALVAAGLVLRRLRGQARRTPRAPASENR